MDNWLRSDVSTIAVRTYVRTDGSCGAFLQVLSVSFASAFGCLLVIMVCRALFKVGNYWHRSRKGALAKSAKALVWLVNVGLCAFSIVFSAASGHCLSDEDVDGVLYEWSITVFATWTLAEPSLVLGTVIAPFVFGQSACCALPCDPITLALDFIL